MSSLIEGFLGQSIDGKKSRIPARLDFVQSATGLFLGLFMWAHMFFVATILISKDAMYSVARFFEGGFILGEPQPVLVSLVVAFVFLVFIVHAGLGMRKLPINFRQWQAYRTHMGMMKHSDTTLWFAQATTGFIMFFLGSAHLFMMMTKADTIGPFGSGDRMWSDFMWPFYLILLLAVEIHGTIGLYRLCVKWGWFEGKDAKETRVKLKKVKWIVTAFFLTLGILTLIAYVKIGYEHRDEAGQLYKPHAHIQINHHGEVKL